MKTLFAGLSALAVSAFTTQAQATTIDFEGTATGTYNALLLDGVTFTFEGGTGNFNVDNTTPGPPVSGHNLISFFTNPGADPFKAAFSQSGVRNVSIGVGDFNADDDEVHLAAYDSNNALLGTDDDLIAAPTLGGVTLSLSTLADISYILFWETGSFAGALYWDNLTFDGSDVPEPAMLGLLGFGLMAMSAMRRRKLIAK